MDSSEYVEIIELHKQMRDILSKLNLLLWKAYGAEYPEPRQLTSCKHCDEQ